MVIQHNLNAMGAIRHFGNNQSALAKSLEKLSSGYQINSAADGAAYLAISERMRNQITGIEQTEKNVQQNINSVKLAEGTLGEIHSMVDRFKELATISANSTFTDDERADMQREVDQLAQEINRMAACNGLLGSGSCNVEDGNIVPLQNELVMEYVGTTTEEGVESGKIMVSLGSDKTGELSDEQLASIQQFISDFETTNETGITFDFSGIFDSISEESTQVETASPAETVTKNTPINTSFTTSSNTDNILQLNLDLPKKVFQGESNRPLFGNREKIEEAEGFSLSEMHEITNNISSNSAHKKENKEKSNDSIYSSSLSISNSTPQVSGELNLQVGPTADSYNMMTVPAFDMSMNGLGLESFDVSTQESAQKGIEMVGNATNMVSSARAAYGGILNAFQHRLNVLSTTKQNLTEAESLIRDTNFAEEMMEYTKLNVLVQASQSMVAQANQFPENVLMFLQ